LKIQIVDSSYKCTPPSPSIISYCVLYPSVFVSAESFPSVRSADSRGSRGRSFVWGTARAFHLNARGPLDSRRKGVIVCVWEK